MRLSGLRVVTFTDYLSSRYDDRSYSRIGPGPTFGAARQIQGLLHIVFSTLHVRIVLFE